MIEYSIVVPVRNAARHIEPCLESLLSIDYPVDRFEILVVDNRSEDGTLELIRGRFPAIKVLSESKLVSSYSARNLGAKEASGRRLLFVDSDCVADSRILTEYDLHLTESQALAGGVRFRFADPRNPCEIYDSQRWLQQRRSALNQNFGCTANMLVRRDLFLKAGQFPAGFYSGGDYYFGQQLGRLGVRVGYVDSAIVYHPTRTSLQELTAKATRIGVGNRQVFEQCRDHTCRQEVRILMPRFARIWKMKKAVSGDLRLFFQLLWIDWRVNWAIRSAYLKGSP